MSKQGYIKLHRQIQECLFWEDKPFNMAAAWVDLLLLANHEDKETIFDKKPILVKRGQRITSVRILAERWGWGNEKTLKFLRILEEQHMITRETNNRRTLITIVNYDIYQSNNDDNRTQAEQLPNSSRTLAEQSSSTNKNDKNDNNDNNDNNNITTTVISLFNEICVSLPKVRKVTKDREKAVKTRLITYTLEEIKEAFRIAEQTNFLKGANKNNWVADFDWIMKDQNMAKVLERKYDREPNKQFNNSNYGDKPDALTQKLMSVAGGMFNDK